MPPADGLAASAAARGITVRRAFLFLVDWRRAMLRGAMMERRRDTDVAGPTLAVTLRAIADIMQRNIMGDSGDQYGVVAFGTSETADAGEWPRVNVIRKMSKLDANAITTIQRAARKAEELGKLDEDSLDTEIDSVPEEKLFRFGPDEPVQFDQALWCARNQMQQLSVKNSQTKDIMYRLNIVILTTDEDPITDPKEPGPGRARKAFKQAKDLLDPTALDATIRVMILGKAENEDTQDQPLRFFDKVVQGGEDVPEVHYYGNRVERGVSTGDEIVDSFQRSYRSKRAVCRTSFTLGDGYTFGVAAYLLVSKKRRPNKVELFKDDSTPIRRITTNLCNGVGKTLKDDEIRYWYDLPCLKKPRGKPVAEDSEIALPTVWGFTKQETYDITAISPRGIALYGFKKRSAFKPECTMRAPFFLQPDESSYEGSKAVFIQLLDSMLRKNVVGIVRTSLRKNAPPRFAVLVPHDATPDDDWRKRKPAGFYLHPLPYKNDVRHTWRKELPTDPPTLEEDEPIGTGVARRIIKGLTISEFHPDMFCNPDLTRFHRGLAAKAGVENEPELPSSLDPNVTQFEKKRGEALREFKAMTMGEDFDGAEVAEEYGTATGKRAREAKVKAEEQKKLRKQDNLDAIAALDTDMYQSGSLHTLRKAELFLYVAAYELKTKGKLKADLIEAIEGHLALASESKPKEEDMPAVEDNVLDMSIYKVGRLNKLNDEQLSAYVIAHGLKMTGGSKADLVDAVEAHLIGN